MNPAKPSRSKRPVLTIRLAAVAALALAAPAVHAQVSLTTLGTPYTQNFDGLPASGSATWTNNTTIPGWYHARTGTGTTIVANDGLSNAGNLYSYGTGTQANRALGSLGSGNAAIGNLFWGVRLQNNTGSTITSLVVDYFGEQWRNSLATPAHTVAFSYLVGTPTVTGSLAEFQSAGVAVSALDFTGPVTTGAAATALDGNAAANRVQRTFTITGLSIPNGTEVMLRWSDPDHTGADHALAIDDLTITPQGSGGNAAVVPTCPATLTTIQGTATSGPISATDADGTVTSATITAITPSDPGTIAITGFTPAGGVGGTANGTLDVSNTTPLGSFGVTIQWTNNDATPQTATCNVAVSVTPPPTVAFIHDVQGNGAATPIPGATVTVEGVVTGDYQNGPQLDAFFLQEEDIDADADPNTSEGIFVFCGACPTPIAEGQRVRVTGIVSEFFGMTEITASTAGSVVVTNAGNNLGQVTPAPIDLPVVGVLNDFYESREGMLVTFVDALSVSEYFEIARFGTIELFEGGRPRQFTESTPPSVPGYAAHLDTLARRRVILDDDNDNQNGSLTPFQPEGQQFNYHPRANGGLSVGTQGVDFFRGGDLVNGLAGVLHWSFSGLTGTDAWRIRPTAARPANFTVANPRPVAAPAVGGAIKGASMNLLNYFTTIDTTSSTSSGPCGPNTAQDCRGADSVAELNRQRERTSLVVCGLDAHVFGFMELENTSLAAITDLLGAVNARCGGASPYVFATTGGTLGTDAIRVAIVYRSAMLSPVGPPLADPDPVHNRPPTAQTFDVIDPASPAFGQRFTVIANHFKSKGCGGASGGDLDANDGQACFAATRAAQAARLLTWINTAVLPAAGDPDVLLLGDFNAYPQETAVTTLTGGGFTDLQTALLGPSAYSYLFDGQLGHLDYAFTSSSLTPQVASVGPWHINADESDLFDYNDEVKDVGEAAFEEKSDGSALVPPRVLFQPLSVYRASDHDPVLVGLFRVSDLVVTDVDAPDPVLISQNLTHTITVTNNGSEAAHAASWSDKLAAGVTFVSLTSAPGWSCTTPAVGAGGIVSCTNPSFAVGSAAFDLVVALDPALAGSVIENTVTLVSSSLEGAPGNESATASTTVQVPVDLMSFEVK